VINFPLEPLSLVDPFNPFGYILFPGLSGLTLSSSLIYLSAWINSNALLGKEKTLQR
jgi:hypothetical protein